MACFPDTIARYDGGSPHADYSRARRKCTLEMNEEQENMFMRYRDMDISLNDRLNNSSNTKLIATKVALHDLRLTNVAELYVDEVAYGQCVHLRTIEQAKPINGITTIVEDHVGNVVLFCAYNFTDSLSPDLSDILPHGTMFYLKEPYINENWTRDKHNRRLETYLRCDCPSDIIVLHEGHRMFADSNKVKWYHDLINLAGYKSWLELGDLLFNRRQFEQAARCYFLVLKHLKKIPDGENMAEGVTLKIAETYNKRGFYEKALNLVYGIPRSKGSRLIAAQSWYILKKYDYARQFIAQCNDPKLNFFKDMCDLRLAEEKGRFSMYQYFHDQNCSNFHLADYTGPVAIVEKLNSGRCVVATEDIQPGTLVIASEALAFSQLIPQSNTKPKDVTKGWEHVVAQLAQKILKNPASYGELIYNLPGAEKMNDKRPIQLICSSMLDFEPIVDVEKLQAIVKNCIFGMDTSSVDKHGFKFCCTLDGGVGVFHKPSFFNHSCLPNASVHNFGKNLFIRTIQFVEKGEELFLPYASWKIPYKFRAALCMKHFFVCGCRLCKLEEKSQWTDRRNKILEKYMNLMIREFLNRYCPDIPALIEEISHLIEEFNKTYDNQEQFPEFPEKLSMSVLYFSLAVAYYLFEGTDSRKIYKIIECYQFVLKCHGFDPQIWLETIDAGEFTFPRNALLDQDVIDSVYSLIIVYRDLKDREKQTKWYKILCNLEKIYSGGDKRVVNLRHKLNFT